VELLNQLLRQILNSLSLVLKNQAQIISLQQKTDQSIAALSTKLDVVSGDLIAIAKDQSAQDALLETIVKNTTPPPPPQPAGFSASLTVD